LVITSAENKFPFAVFPEQEKENAPVFVLQVLLPPSDSTMLPAPNMSAMPTATIAATFHDTFPNKAPMPTQMMATEANALPVVPDAIDASWQSTP
jgi:hypothetical protein